MTARSDIDYLYLPVCTSTQLVVRDLLAQRPSRIHVVRCDEQTAGAGRAGRTWENPPGSALMLSVALRGSYPARVLVDLVRRIVDSLAVRLAATFALDPGALAWKSPNDLVCAATGAKVAGILADSVTIGDQLQELCVGIGVNVTGAAWTTTADGRAATTLEALAARELLAGVELLDELACDIGSDIAALLATESQSSVALTDPR